MKTRMMLLTLVVGATTAFAGGLVDKQAWDKIHRETDAAEKAAAERCGYPVPKVTWDDNFHGTYHWVNPNNISDAHDDPMTDIAGYCENLPIAVAAFCSKGPDERAAFKQSKIDTFVCHWDPKLEWQDGEVQDYSKKPGSWAVRVVRKTNVLHLYVAHNSGNIADVTRAWFEKNL